MKRGALAALARAATIAILVGLPQFSMAAPAHAERRVALVVGNATYAHAPVLRNPVQDATEVGSLLKSLDFDVTTVINADKVGLETAIRRFSGTLENADVALFYYSGHAFQVSDRNYLVPTSAEITGPRDLNLDTFALQDIRAAMRRGGARVQILFLDACRDNPFGEALAGPAKLLTRGLAPIDVPTGSLVVYSTSPGQAALDGTGRLSPFTDAFTHYATEPKLEIRQVLTRVRTDVSRTTDNRQVPWDDSSLTSDFYLVPPKPAPVFDHALRVTIGAGTQERPLNLPAPAQPEGGPVTIVVSRPPSAGRLKVGERIVAANDTLSDRDFATLSYAASGNVSTDSFAIDVQDAWGNVEHGTVSLLVEQGEPAHATTDQAQVPDVQDSVFKAVSLIGLGPNLAFTATAGPKARDGDLLELAEDVPLGQLLLGDRVLEQGRRIDAADLTRLAFNAPIGSAGRHIDLDFRPVQRGLAPLIRIGIDLALTDCDRLAGDRLDSQGVSDGVLTGQIETAAALPACQTAAAARPGVARFTYQLGRIYSALARNGDALTAYRTAADLGHTRALWALGNHDEYSQPPDFARGKDELERAAAAGDVYAIHSLGLVYFEGRGVSKDIAKARDLFEQAARVGHTFAMNSLGRMYETGEGAAQDPAMARRYWEESAKRGDMYGIDNLGFAYLDGTGVEKDGAKALAYFKQASELGHPEAPNNIGRLYVLGLGVPVDFKEARKWDRVGADRGDGWAAFNLAELNRLGRGAPADPAVAAYYYARAAAATNRLEPSQLGRSALAGIDRKAKGVALRHLLKDLDGSATPPTDERALIAATRAALARRNVTVSDGDLDAVLVATAGAEWTARAVRNDLF